MPNFAITGIAGYIAPRHLQAMKQTGNTLVAALDPHDSVGLLDRYFPDASFFTEFERFDRHMEKLRRGPAAGRVHYLSVCSPNYLHDAHIRYALRLGAHAICEKPLVLKPWNLDALAELEVESGGRVSTVLQLRLHPALTALRDRLAADKRPGRRDVCLTYVTPRGRWYAHSWKGNPERSGGLVTNIGIHLFDLMLWLFGRPSYSLVHVADSQRVAGFIELERANVRWFLSTDRGDVPAEVAAEGDKTFRSITVDGEAVEFSEGFTDLHTRVYEETLAGRGFGIADARPSIQLVHDLRNTKPCDERDHVHPFAVAGGNGARRLDTLGG